MEKTVLISVTKGDERLSEWFTLPIREEEFSERLDISVDSSEYSIVSHDFPFPVYEDTSVERLNKLYDMYDDLSYDFSDTEIKEILINGFNGRIKNIDDLYSEFESANLCVYDYHNGNMESLVDEIIGDEHIDNKEFENRYGDIEYLDIEYCFNRLFDNDNFYFSEDGAYFLDF